MTPDTAKQIESLRRRLREVGSSGGSLEELNAIADEIRRLIMPIGAGAVTHLHSNNAVKFCEHITRATDTIVKTDCRSCGGKLKVGFQAFVCDLHGRCLPRYNPAGDMLDKWMNRKPESDIYRLCGKSHCSDFVAGVGGSD